MANPEIKLGLIDRIKAAFGAKPAAAAATEPPQRPIGKGVTYEGNPFLRSPYLLFQVDHDYNSIMADVNKMDLEDGRVKQIHNKIARDATRSGVSFISNDKTPSPKMADEAKAFIKRCRLDEREKLKSDARFLVKDGELFLENVMDDQLNVVAMRRLPSVSMRPNVDATGRFRDITKAYLQYEPITNQIIATFAAWQITHIRRDANADDPGDRGRPLFDADRVTWKKLVMTEEDLVIRRRTRAPLRSLHTLEGATDAELEAYMARNKDVIEHPLDVMSDYFSNKKGSVQPIQGDANLDQINDVKELKDDFFAGIGMPRHLVGYLENINRDVYADSLEAYYEILEEVQELLADGYEAGLRLQYLLRGINADGYDWDLTFNGRKVESDNQLADRMLKHKALGIPNTLVWPQLKYNVDQVNAARAKEAATNDPYEQRLQQELGGTQPGGKKITNVNGNARKGESAVSVKN